MPKKIQTKKQPTAEVRLSPNVRSFSKDNKQRALANRLKRLLRRLDRLDGRKLSGRSGEEVFSWWQFVFLRTSVEGALESLDTWSEEDLDLFLMNLTTKETDELLFAEEDEEDEIKAA